MGGDVVLKAAILGRMDEELIAARDFFEECAQRAVFETAAEFQSQRRQDWMHSGIKRAAFLSKTVRLRKYTNHGKDPAALVYSTIPIIEQAFERGETIRSKHGWFLLIPNPEIWGTNRVALRRRGGASALEIATRRFGTLQYVYRKNNLSLLVTTARESAKRPGVFRHASKTALQKASAGKESGLASIIVFFLVPSAKLQRRLHGDVLRKRWERTGPEKISAKFVRFFDEGPQSGRKALPAPSGE